MNRIKKNYLYNLAYQIFSLITPLVVTPYISRVLGSSGVGQYSFTYSLVTYFVLFASFGFNTYAQREIARFQGNKKAQTTVFWEVFVARLFTVLISLALYFLILFSGVYGETYTKLMLILAINIFAVIFDVSFLYQANEHFGLIAIRNIIVKLVGVICILIFVRDESHVWIYTLCQSVISIISSLTLWMGLPKVLERDRINNINYKRHFIPALRLFIPTIAISVYTMLDKTLLGLLIPGTAENGMNISDIENGYYDQAEKLVKMALTVITSLGTVMIPRNSKLIADGNINGFKMNIQGALRFVFFLGMPIMFGLAAVSRNISPWFFGPGYEKVPYLMMLFSSLIIIIGLSNVLGIQYLLPMKRDKKYTIAITSGAMLNLLLNILLIPYLWSFGACVATIIAELVVTGLMFYFARDDVKLVIILKMTWKYIVSSIVMFGLVYYTQIFLVPSILHTILLILEGGLSYLVMLLMLKDKLLIEYIELILNRKHDSNTSND